MLIDCLNEPLIAPVETISCCQLAAASFLLERGDRDTADHLRIHDYANLDAAVGIIGKFDAEAKQFFSGLVFVINQFQFLDIACFWHCSNLASEASFCLLVVARMIVQCDQIGSSLLQSLCAVQA